MTEYSPIHTPAYTPEEIKQLRIDLGMTQRQFARTVGVDTPRISLWENGKAKPSLLAEGNIKRAIARLKSRRWRKDQQGRR